MVKNLEKTNILFTFTFQNLNKKYMTSQDRLVVWCFGIAVLGGVCVYAIHTQHKIKLNAGNNGLEID